MTKNVIPKSPLPQKNPRKQVTEKAFHKNAKTCRAGFHKKPTKQDGTHMTIRSQITIPTSITHTTISPAYIPPIFNHAHTTQHTVTTTHSPSQLHLLYTQNSLNTHHKLLVHIPQLFPYSASSINATAWSHSTPQTLTSTSKQILHYHKHLHHSCWYLKGTVYKAMASCENCETISGVYKSAMAQATCTSWSMGFVPSDFAFGKTYYCPRVQIPCIQLETHGTTITLLSTPFNAHPNPQSNPTIHNTGNYGVCG